MGDLLGKGPSAGMFQDLLVNWSWGGQVRRGICLARAPVQTWSGSAWYVALGWPSVLGDLFVNWPWGAQVHWGTCLAKAPAKARSGSTWQQALGWPGALGLCRHTQQICSVYISYYGVLCSAGALYWTACGYYYTPCFIWSAMLLYFVMLKSLNNLN